ncbi:hypothetical protein ACA910_010382 [Epithemia clementina (nom. ined.)]
MFDVAHIANNGSTFCDWRCLPKRVVVWDARTLNGRKRIAAIDCVGVDHMVVVPVELGFWPGAWVCSKLQRRGLVIVVGATVQEKGLGGATTDCGTE